MRLHPRFQICLAPGGIICPLRHVDCLPQQVAALVAAFGAELDDVVGGGDDVGVVLYHDDGVATVDEGAEGGEEFLYVVEMQAGGRLVEDEENRLVRGRFAA